MRRSRAVLVYSSKPTTTFCQFFAPTSPAATLHEGYAVNDSDDDDNDHDTSPGYAPSLCSSSPASVMDSSTSSSTSSSPPPDKPVRREGAHSRRQKRDGAGRGRARRLFFSRSLSPILQSSAASSLCSDATNRKRPADVPLASPFQFVKQEEDEQDWTCALMVVDTSLTAVSSPPAATSARATPSVAERRSSCAASLMAVQCFCGPSLLSALLVIAARRRGGAGARTRPPSIERGSPLAYTDLVSITAALLANPTV